jgi:5-oxopent-3-ene-1,2,5-tricarboxylate decarboxylase / 2-hydroxyhepta-2,4-diene-1,7-dioate isomerase
MLSDACDLPRFVERPPWRLSGVVVGAALNDPDTLEALGAAVDAAPYRGAPRAPVLYVKPRHTLARADAPLQLPADAPAVEVGATIALLVGRTLCRASPEEALDAVTGHALAVDLSLPLASFYRPAARAKALDGSCHIGAIGAPHRPDVFGWRVSIDGRTAQRAGSARYTRAPAQLLADVSGFMTLRAGDLVLLGVAQGAPLARAGQRVRIEAEGLAPIEFDVEAGA